MCFCALSFIEHFPALLHAVQPERDTIRYFFIRPISVVKRFECFRAVFALVVYLDPVLIAYFGQRETHSRRCIDCVHYNITHGVFPLISAAGRPAAARVCFWFHWVSYRVHKVLCRRANLPGSNGNVGRSRYRSDINTGIRCKSWCVPPF